MGGDHAVFHRFATPYDIVMPPARRSILRAGLALADRDIERVLDLAGGTGRAVRAVAVPDPVVLDAAPGMTRRARGRGLPAIVGDGGRLPLRGETVDAVLIVDALHHLSDYRAVLAEVVRVLRPGGAVIVREFDPRTLRGRLLEGLERLMGFDSRFHSPEALAKAVRAAGLTPHVPDRGFGFTVVGIKSSATGESRGGARRRDHQ